MKTSDFNQEAKKFIKRVMLEEDLSYSDLTEKLKEKGFSYSEASVIQKVNRGRFDFAFVLQIAEALGYKIEAIKK